MSSDKPDLAFCERVTATPLSPWHIRRVGAEGRRYGVGALDTTLCGGSLSKGWDLHRAVDHKSVLLLLPDRSVCPASADAFFAIFGGNS